MKSALGAAPRLDALTSMRFFAAFYVVLFHGGSDLFRQLKAPMWAEILRGTGYVAVSFFFVLSGFILTYNYARGPRGSVRLRRFLWARFSRIYPVYALGLLLMVPFVLRYDASQSFLSALASVSLLQAWFPSVAFGWNPPGWSISDEAFFYLLFPLAAARLSGDWSNRRLLLVMALLWCLSLLAPALFLRLSPSPTGPWPTFVRFAPLFRLAEFLIGVCLGKIYLNDIAQGTTRRGWLMFYPALLLLPLCLLSSAFIPGIYFNNGLLSPLFCLLLLGQVYDRGPANRLLSLRPLVEMGDASYALYILQEPLAMIMLMVGGGDLYQRIYGLEGRLFVGYSVVLIIASVLTHRLIERPLQRQLRGWLTS